MTELYSQTRKFASDRQRQGLLAGVLWVVLTAIAVSIFVLGTLGLYNGVQEPCVAFLGQAREFCLERQESLTQLGISIFGYTVFLVVSAIVQVLPWILVGVAIFGRKSGELFGILFSLALILLGTVALDSSLADWTLFYHPGLALPVMVVEFVGIALIALLYVFPNGEFVPRWTRWLALVWALGAFVSVFLRGILDFIAPPVIVNSIAAILAASFLYSLGSRYFQSSNALQQRQIRWLALGAMIYGVVYFLRLLPTFQGGAAVTLYQLLYVALLAVSSCLFALCLGASILRPRLLARSDTTPRMASANVNTVTAVPVEKPMPVETAVPIEKVEAVQPPKATTKVRKKKKKGKKRA